MLAKSKDAAARLSKEIRDKSTKKTYLARVKGQFPAKRNFFRYLKLEEILDIAVDDDDDDDDDEGREDKGKNKNKKDRNDDSAHDSKINKKDFKGKFQKKQQQQEQMGQKRDRNGTIKKIEINEADLPPRVRLIPTFEDVVSSDRVGVSDVVSESGSGVSSFILCCPIGTCRTY